MTAALRKMHPGGPDSPDTVSKMGELSAVADDDDDDDLNPDAAGWAEYKAEDAGPDVDHETGVDETDEMDWEGVGSVLEDPFGP